VADLLQGRGIDVVVSAGYMRLLGRTVLEAYGGRWLNVHPSLLPAFPGMRGVADALAYGVRVTGVTVFLVDQGMDTGPVVLQEAIEVREDDDWDSLEARVHEVEHRLLPAATAALVEGRIHIEGRTVTIDGGST
jgi:phosphoribosylglycinamide formyltransferase 1